MRRTLRRLLAATALSATMLTATAAPAVAAPPPSDVICIIYVLPDGTVIIICIP